MKKEPKYFFASFVYNANSSLGFGVFYAKEESKFLNIDKIYKDAQKQYGYDSIKILYYKEISEEEYLFNN